MKRPAISVIVPIYNAEKYLYECLESIREQTFSDLEIICVNDGSTDDSLKILQSFASKDARFMVISQDNQGVNMARANGYRKATGEYIAWVDNDDVLNKDMYKKMHDKAEKDKSDIVICNYELYPRNIARKEVWYKPYRGINDWKFIAHNTTLWNKIVRRSLLDEIDIIGLFNDMGESAYGIVLASSSKITTIDEVLYKYRVGHGSVSGSYDNMNWYETTVSSAKAKYDYADKNNMTIEIREYFFYCYMYYNLVLMSVAARNGEKEIYKKARKIVKSNYFFDKEYKEFFVYNINSLKRFFFRYCIYSNYYIAKVATKVVLR